jgi:LmbE family N-acetylglucosaminyl deacetylase
VHQTQSARPWRGLVASLFFFLFTSISQAGTSLVVAPHPDDEALCCSGIIFNALQRGDTVYIVVLTNGDTKGTTVGLRREGETVAAMGLLGIPEQHIIFLGYGDGLTLALYESSNPNQNYTSFAGATATYGNRGLGGTDYHDYLYGVHGSYNRSTMMQDVTAALRNIHPDEIYTTGVVDGHSDHEATSMAVMEAIRTIEGSDSTFRPRLHETVIHAPNDDTTWPEPVFTPAVPYSASQYMGQTPLDWTQIESVPLPAPMQDLNPATNLKHQVINTYQSQITQGFNDWLFSFIKENEYFWVRTPRLDVAMQATVTDSSEASGGNNAGAKAIDGEIPSQFGAYYAVPTAPITDREWVTDNQARAWIQLNWKSAVTVNEVLLSDRSDPNQNVLSGTLTFSDGSSISVGALPVYGTPYPITFSPKTITWTRFTITGAKGTATGLAEFQVLAPSTPVPVAITFNPYQVAAGASFQGNVTLSAPNPTGTTTVQLASDNSAVSVPAAVTVPVGLTNEAFTATAAAWAQAGQANVTATAAGVSAAGIVKIVTTPSLTGISLDNNNVTGGATVNCTITLSAPAPTDAVVSIASTNSAARVPASETITAGTASKTFPIPTTSVTSVTTGTINAGYNGAQVSTSLTVTPRTTLSITSVSVSPAYVAAGNSAQGSFKLSAAAPTGGAIVNISSDNSAAVPPATVSVPAGQSGGSFTVTTTLPAAPTTANLTATLAGSKQSTPLRLELTVPANLASTATVTVSSQNTSSGQLGTKAVDRIVDGYPGDSSREWATNGQTARAWINLAWPGAVTVSEVILYDRPNSDDNITSGTLSFSNGSTIAVGALPNNGAALVVSFPARAVTSLKFTINSATGYNTGLAEIVVLGSTSIGVANVSLNSATVTGGSSSTGTVTLTGAAPAGGAAVTLASSNGAAKAPTSVTVQAGQTSANFTITTSVVSSSTSLSITASYAGSMASVNLTVSPSGVSLTTGQPYTFQDSSGNTMDLGWALNPQWGYGIDVYLYSYNNGPSQQLTYTTSDRLQSVQSPGQYLYSNGGVLTVGPVGDTFSITSSGSGYTIYDNTVSLYVNTPGKIGPPNGLTLSSTPTVWTPTLQ